MKLFEYYAKWKMSIILTWMNNFGLQIRNMTVNYVSDVM